MKAIVSPTPFCTFSEHSKTKRSGKFKQPLTVLTAVVDALLALAMTG